MRDFTLGEKRKRQPPEKLRDANAADAAGDESGVGSGEEPDQKLSRAGGGGGRGRGGCGGRGGRGRDQPEVSVTPAETTMDASVGDIGGDIGGSSGGRGRGQQEAMAAPAETTAGAPVVNHLLFFFPTAWCNRIKSRPGRLYRECVCRRSFTAVYLATACDIHELAPRELLLVTDVYTSYVTHISHSLVFARNCIDRQRSETFPLQPYSLLEHD